MRIACIGEAMIELSMDGDTAQVGVAGDTLNTAIYLHRTAPDLHVDYMTHLGDDPFSAQIKDFIAAQGVGTQSITTVPGASPGLYAISTSDTGERSFTYWRSTSAARGMFQTNGVCDFSDLGQYDAIYLSGISMAILPQPVRLALINWLNESDIQLVYDSNYRPRLWENVETARMIAAAMWVRADILLPSLDDEMELFGETADAVTARFVAHQGKGALKQSALGPMSLGENVRQTYASAARVVDTTAAGDSFNGAYLGAVLSGQSQAQSLMAGHLCAATVVQHRGAIMPA